MRRACFAGCSGALLVTLLLTGCGGESPDAVGGTLVLPSAPATTEMRTLAPEGSGPIATITPTPLATPSEASPAPSLTPIPSSSPPAADDEDDAQVVVTPKPKKSKKPSAQPTPASNCDPNYSGACVPIVSWDLDCADIGETVTVEGTDIHRFDADGDGSGCESY